MGSEVTSFHQYPHFRGIWHEIDNNNFERLVNHPKLLEAMNEKQQGLTPLHLACLRKNKTIVEFLLSSGADPNIVCHQRTPLYTVTFFGEEELIELLLRYGADPNSMCKKVAPVHLAALKGRVDILEILFNYDANLSLQSPQFGTALHIAAKKNHKFIARFLIEHNANPNLFDEDGETPLHIACRCGRIEIVNLMLEHSKDLNPFLKEKTEGNTALHLAAINGHWDVYRAIFKRYPELAVVKNDSENKTSFFYIPPTQRLSFRDSYIARRSRITGFGHLLTECNRSQSSSALLNPHIRLFSDLVIRTKDTQPPRNLIYCHKAILWARCPFLRPLLTDQNILKAKTSSNSSSSSNNNNNNSNGFDTLDFPQVSYNSLFPVIYYLYSNKLKCDKEHLPGVLTVAEYFQIPRLVAMIQSELGKPTTIPESTFVSDMQQLVNNKLFADVIFIIPNSNISQQSNKPRSQKKNSQYPNKDVIYAHKAILISRSEYFKVMFLPTAARENPDILKSLNNWMGSLSLDENKQLPAVVIKDITFQMFFAIIRYSYTWIVNGTDLNGNTVSELLEASTRMMFERLHEQCENFICHHITLTNVCEMLELAQTFNSTLLKEECIDFILRNYDELQRLNEWKELKESVDEEIQKEIAIMGQKKKRNTSFYPK